MEPPKENATTEQKGMAKDILKICSININGLNNKLDAIQIMIEDNEIDIMGIQETHAIDLQKLEKWAKLFNYKVFINQLYVLPKNKFSKEGTITIITKKIFENFCIKEELICQNRIHHIKIYNENQELSILNCYFPNRVKDRTKLIELMIRKYKSPNTNNIILGDFNFIESKLDTKNQHLFTITKDKKTFKLFKNENGIIDIFRKKNKTQKIYTFKNKKGATRIDRIYEGCLKSNGTV